MSVIKLENKIYDEVRHHLFSKPGEHFGFLSADACPSPEGPILLVRDFLPIPDDQVSVDSEGWEVSIEAILSVVNHAVRNNRSLIEVHNHSRGPAMFSSIDRNGLNSFVPYMLDSIPNRPYVATVWTTDDIYGEYFEDSPHGSVIRSITIIGNQFRQLTTDTESRKPNPRLARQESWISSVGQSGFSRYRIGVVGVGGTGSLVIQNLAYLGVQDFVLVDNDTSDVSNMNRLVTASMADLARPKTILAQNLIRGINPDAIVKTLTMDLRTQPALSHLKEVDIVFGCVDNDGARLVLNELCRAYSIPYFDLGVGLEADSGKVISAGGRVASIIPGGPCLRCLGEIDQKEARYFLSSAQDQETERQLGYVEGLDEPAPAVISLNATIASIAVNEFTVFITGARNVSHYLEYDLLGRAYEVPSQRIDRRTESQRSGCVLCAVEGIGDKVEIERYIIDSEIGES